MTTPTTNPQQARKAVLASWIGTTIEYYDFAGYGLAASLILGKLFFPSANPAVGVLLSLSTFAVGYFVRPLGALVFGHFGDRLGRKRVLVVTLVMMGLSTFAIGLLPSYDRIGFAAPVLLVVARVVQGFSVGGEYGGAALLTVEHGGQSRRGLLGSVMNTGVTAGLLLANVVYLLVALLPADQLMSWGWRVPFLFSAVLVVVGFAIRRALDETPDFARLERREVHRMPIVTVLRTCGGRVLLVAGATVGAGTLFTIATVYSLAYAKPLGISGRAMLAVLLPALVVVLVCLPLFGRLADRVGIRRLFLVGAVTMVVTPFLWFALLDTRNYGLMLLGFIVMLVGYSANFAVFPAYFAAAFPPAVRFTGMSVGFTLGVVAGNAIAPTVAAALLEATGGWPAIAIYVAVTALISLAAGTFLRVPVQSGQESALQELPAS